MLTRRIQKRVPSAQPITVGVLSGYELRWHKISIDGSGKCDVFHTGNSQDLVYGIIYEILASEKAKLDDAEGLGNGYDEKEITLETAFGTMNAWVYYATRTDPSALPYTWYKALVFAGANEHSLPIDYINKLVNVSAKIDSDKERAEKNFAIANAL